MKRLISGLFSLLILTPFLSASVKLDIPEIPSKDLVQGQLIKGGSFGDVYRGTWKGQPVAIKKLRMATLGPQLIADFKKETQLMRQCQFPNILRLHGVCTEPGHYAMVLELMERDLSDLLQSTEDISEKKRWKIALDIAQGLWDLHRSNILHRDLKSPNILLDGGCRSKISDFGLSKVRTGSSIGGSHVVGSVRWCSPEVIDGEAPTSSSDMYSYGMILWEIATGQIPFRNDTDMVIMRKVVDKGLRETIPADCPPLWVSIIEDCWKKNPSERPTAASIVELLRKYQPLPPKPVWMPEEELDPSCVMPADGFVLIQAAREDWQKVLAYYRHHPVPGYDIGRVDVIHHPAMRMAFTSTMALLKQRKGTPRYAATWSQEHDAAWRQEVHKKTKDLAIPYQDEDNPDVQLMPLWHGTQKSNLRGILSAGYAPFCDTDDGYFGKGIYGAQESVYSQMYANKCSGAHNPDGVLILNWAVMYSGFPIISSDYDPDNKKLTRSINPAIYDAHFIPVVQNPSGGYGDYIPTNPGQVHTYTEVMVRDRAQMLPRYLVYLQSSKPPVMDEGVMTNSQVLAMFLALKHKLVEYEASVRQGLKEGLRQEHQAGLQSIAMLEPTERQMALTRQTERERQTALFVQQQAEKETQLAAAQRPQQLGSSQPSLKVQGPSDAKSMFLNSQLIYKPSPSSQEEIVPFILANINSGDGDGEFNLSRCGNSGQYVSINKGYRRGHRTENAKKLEIWFVLRSVVERDLNGPARHLQPIWDKWPASNPVGIFFTWGGWNGAEQLGWYDYLTTQDAEMLSNGDGLHVRCYTAARFVLPKSALVTFLSVYDIAAVQKISFFHYKLTNS